MVLTPDVLAAAYVEAGCQRLIVHAEACTHLHRTLATSLRSGPRPGWRSTRRRRPSAVAHVLDLVDMVLVMTVNPGFGGQEYIATMEPKIREVRAMIEAAGLADDVDIEVDGGIGPATIAGARRRRRQRARRRHRAVPRPGRPRSTRSASCVARPRR